MRSSFVIIATWLALAAGPAAALSEIAGQCFCDSGGSIAINQLIRAVTVALGSAECPPASADVAGQCFCDAGGGIAINQIIRAVNVALGSAECPVVVASPTSTAVATPVATATEAVLPSATRTDAPTPIATATSTATETVAPSATDTDTPTATPTAVSTRFGENGTTVVDFQTGLEWIKTDEDGGITDKDRTFTWSASGTDTDGTAFTQYVAALNDANYGGHSDWRLPSSSAGDTEGPLQAGELESIADCSYPKCLSPIFGPIAGGTYWSASTNPDLPTTAFALSFIEGGNAGTVLADGKGVPKHVRAVRSRP